MKCFLHPLIYYEIFLIFERVRNIFSCYCVEKYFTNFPLNPSRKTLSTTPYLSHPAISIRKSIRRLKMVEIKDLTKNLILTH